MAIPLSLLKLFFCQHSSAILECFVMWGAGCGAYFGIRDPSFGIPFQMWGILLYVQGLFAEFLDLCFGFDDGLDEA